jgi:hypothetical protein
LISPESREPLAHWVISTAMKLSKLPRKGTINVCYLFQCISSEL